MGEQFLQCDSVQSELDSSSARTRPSWILFRDARRRRPTTQEDAAGLRWKTRADRACYARGRGEFHGHCACKYGVAFPLDTTIHSLSRFLPTVRSSALSAHTLRRCFRFQVLWRLDAV